MLGDATLKLPLKDLVYLTFDDGPDPDVTPVVLDLLEHAGAKATFFLRGDQAEKYPGIINRILEEGHAIGNHGYAHLNAWKTPAEAYIRDVQRAAESITSKLFRPPYGKLTPGLAKQLSSNFEIILWSLLTYDYKSEQTAGQCLHLIRQKIKPGDVLVFHDRKPLGDKLGKVLPEVLKFIRLQGWQTGKVG